LRHLRGRHNRTLTVYYHGSDHDYLQERGFKDPERPTNGTEKVKMGVELTCKPPGTSLYGVEHGLKIELPEDFLLSYEWAQETDLFNRVFRVPASVLNRTLKSGESPARNADLESGAED
jgi:hypothetical protein